MQGLQANVHKIVEDQIQEQVWRIEKQAVVKWDILHRKMATTFDQRLEKMLENVSVERQRNMEDWDKSFLERINASLTANQMEIEAKL